MLATADEPQHSNGVSSSTLPTNMEGAEKPETSPEAASSSSPCNADGATSPQNSKLPLQLRRLPKERLWAVTQSLAVLEECGLSELKSIRDLHVVSVNALNQSEITEYRSLCSWSQTSAQWRAAVLPMDPSLHCKLYGKTAEEGKVIRNQSKKSQFTASSAVTPPADHLAKAKQSALRTKHRQTLRRLRKEGKLSGKKSMTFEQHFRNWWATMLASDAEISLFSTDGYQPQILGEGSLPLFALVDKFEPPPPLRIKTKAPGAVQPAMSLIAALALGCAAQPQDRKTHELSFGRSVWFMRLDGDKEFFGVGPEVKWPKKGGRSRSAVLTSRVKRMVNRGPKSVIQLHLGGIGCDIGLATWQRLFAEHRLDGNGRPKPEGLWGTTVTHFSESKTGRYVPRAIFANTDEKSLSDVRQSKMFDPRTIFKSDRTSRSDIVMRELKYNPELSENLRVQLENVDALGGIVSTYGLDCPVGSWLAYDAFSIAELDNGKVFRWSLAMGPSPSEDGLNNSPEPPMTREECFATLWSMTTSVNVSSMVTLMDRRAIAKLVSSPFHGLGQDVTPLYMGQVASKVISGFTSPFRGSVDASVGWSDFTPAKVATNLMPYPRFKFSMPLVSPLQNQAAEDFDTGHSDCIVQKCFNAGSLLSVDTKVGKLMSAGFWCRAVASSTAIDSMAQLRHDRSFRECDFIPGNISVGSQPDSPTGEQDVVALLQHTGIYSTVMRSWLKTYQQHYSQGERCLTDHFIFEDEIEEGKQILEQYLQDTEEVSIDTSHDE